MIIYDSHDWRGMLQMYGSILPKAFLYAVPASLVGATVELLEAMGIVDMSNVISDASVFSGLTFVLGFMLVFRAQQAYARYWVAATASHNMQTRFYEACSNVMAFSQLSKKSAAETARYHQVVVRLFCLLHAVALEELASMMDENFPILDINGLSKDRLSILASPVAKGRKVEIVYQWIKVHIIEGMDKGILNIPAPILSRVFQELGTGLICFHEAHQVVIWPFPYCYVQMTWILLIVTTMLTPVVIAVQTTHVGSCFVFSLISTVCLIGVELIATELEHPFGEDANDLPCFAMQQNFNIDLTTLMSKTASEVPELVEGFVDLSKPYGSVMPLSENLPEGKTKSMTKKHAKQHFWVTLAYDPPESTILQALKLTGDEQHLKAHMIGIDSSCQGELSNSEAVIKMDEQPSKTISALERQPKEARPSEGQSNEVHPKDACSDKLLKRMDIFIEELAENMKRHMVNLERLNEQQLRCTLEIAKANTDRTVQTYVSSSGTSSKVWPCGDVTPANHAFTTNDKNR